jgi:mannose-1-phosphate guanylyltransferase
MMTGSPWAVVLAGGDGQRVSALTRDADGRVLPKQFWSCDGRPPMVRWALARARHIAPAPRVLIVVNEPHRPFWRRELADVPLHNLVVQPSNRGTAAGVLLALIEIQARGSAAAPVVLLPSDHYVADEIVLHHAMLTAVQASRHSGRSAVLLGVSPTEVEPGYGWIVPATADPIARVSQFLEKPSTENAGQMVSRGALINSFILAARVQAMLGLYEQTLPDILRAFRRCTLTSPAELAIRRLYEDLPSLDLSRDVLERASGSLSVVRVPPCGWSDLGTLDRLQFFLAQLDSPPLASSQATRHSATAA